MNSIKVVLISIDKVIKEAFTKQLNDILGDRILIKSYLLHEENIDFSDCDLVVCSSKAIYDDVLSIVTPNIKVIAAYNEPRKQDRQNGQNKLECSYG